MLNDSAGPKTKVGDIASPQGDIRLIHNLTKFCSPREQALIDKLFVKLQRGDRRGLEYSLRSRSVAGLRRRGVLDVERTQ